MTGPVDRARAELRARGLPIIARLRSGRYTEEERTALLDELEALYPYNPYLLDILFLQSGDMTDEQVLDEALRYRPIAL
ncbi:hypothetical protein [Kitasatospora sp. NPDC101183]|uniref:hypothetical protein n=1 Tax=Kitasatospora sp. NPDC101183 TaxID=3364100 RepID=UPI003806FEBB